MKNKKWEYILGFINVLIFVSIVITLCENKYKLPLTNSAMDIDKNCVFIDVSKNRDWFHVYKDYMKSDSSMTSDIMLYNPISDEYIKYKNRYDFHRPSGDEIGIRYIILYFTHNGVWVHTPYEFSSRYTIGEYPDMLHIYTVSSEEYFVKWEDFSELVNKITQRHNGYYYCMTLHMSNDCTITEHFTYYKMLLERFPDEWALYICNYPGAVFPGEAMNYLPKEKTTSKDIDCLIEMLISLLENEENSKENMRKYLEFTQQLSRMSCERYDEVSASISKYAQKLENAYFSNKYIDNFL